MSASTENGGGSRTVGPAPIALFVYNRPTHAQRTLQALAANHLAAESDLFIFADGPKDQDRRTLDQVVDTRRVARGAAGFRSLSIFERATNLGLARSIITGVSDIVARAGQVIVLEDDMETSVHFLRYMNDGLDRYRDVARVMSIHGYSFPHTIPLPDTFLLRGAECWGWATWKRAWDLFESDGVQLHAKLRAEGLLQHADLDGAARFTRAILRQSTGREDAWSARWHCSACLHGGLSVHPGKSLVRNFGTDGSGVHCKEKDSTILDSPLSSTPLRVGEIPIAEHREAIRAYRAFFRRIRPKTPILDRVARRLRRLTLGRSSP